MTTARKPGRDQVAALAGVAAPLALGATRKFQWLRDAKLTTTH